MIEIVSGATTFHADAAAIVAVLARIREGMPLVRGCERCATLCVEGAVKCECCARYGTRMGGSRIVYVEDGKHHVVVLSAAEFELAYGEVAA